MAGRGRPRKWPENMEVWEPRGAKVRFLRELREGYKSRSQFYEDNKLFFEKIDISSADAFGKIERGERPLLDHQLEPIAKYMKIPPFLMLDKCLIEIFKLQVVKYNKGLPVVDPDAPPDIGTLDSCVEPNSAESSLPDGIFFDAQTNTFQEKDFYKMGMAANKMGYCEDALKFLSKFVGQLRPDMPSYIPGDCYFLMGNFSKAFDSYLSYINENKSRGVRVYGNKKRQLYFRIGVSAFSLSDYRRKFAFKYFEDSGMKYPYFDEACFFHGINELIQYPEFNYLREVFSQLIKLKISVEFNQSRRSNSINYFNNTLGFFEEYDLENIEFRSEYRSAVARCCQELVNRIDKLRCGDELLEDCSNALTEAYKDFNRFIKLSPNCSWGYLGKLIVDIEQEHWDDGLACLDAITRIGKHDLVPEVYLLKASLFKELKSTSQVDINMKRYRNLEGNHVDDFVPLYKK